MQSLNDNLETLHLERSFSHSPTTMNITSHALSLFGFIIKRSSLDVRINTHVFMCYINTHYHHPPSCSPSSAEKQNPETAHISSSLIKLHPVATLLPSSLFARRRTNHTATTTQPATITNPHTQPSPSLTFSFFTPLPSQLSPFPLHFDRENNPMPPLFTQPNQTPNITITLVFLSAADRNPVTGSLPFRFLMKETAQESTTVVIEQHKKHPLPSSLRSQTHHLSV